MVLEMSVLHQQYWQVSMSRLFCVVCVEKESLQPTHTIHKSLLMSLLMMSYQLHFLVTETEFFYDFGMNGCITNKTSLGSWDYVQKNLIRLLLLSSYAYSFLIESLSINLFDQKPSEFKYQLFVFWLTISSGSKLPDLTDKQLGTFNCCCLPM